MKVSGFTTLELAVSMVLAALVTGIGYGGYTLFLKQLHYYNKNLEECISMRNLQSLLYRDFYTCEYLEKAGDRLIAHFKENKKVDYELEGAYMLRSQGVVTDTFKFQVRNVQFEFNGTQQFIQGGKVDLLTLEVEFKKQPLILTYYKEYSRGDLMEWEEGDEYRYQ